MAQGGKRKGAGRKPETKITQNNTTFFARCTEKEKELLKESLENLRQTPKE